VDAGVTDTRQRILDAALTLFAERGYRATSIRLIAERVGLTKAAILYHFPSKDHVLAALGEPFLDGLEAAVGRAAELPPREARWVLLTGWLDVMLAQRGVLGLLMHDLALLARDTTFPRMVAVAERAHAIIAGPAPGLADRVRAVQALAMLGDPVVFLDAVDERVLRAEMLRGLSRLLGGPPYRGAPTRAAESKGNSASRGSPAQGDAAPAATRSRPGEPAVTGGGRRPAVHSRGPGRPRVMTAEKVAAARRLLAGGTRTVTDVAAELGVSRATVYRHLGRS
jgi:AcrR family transcriptional regulator